MSNGHHGGPKSTSRRRSALRGAQRLRVLLVGLLVVAATEVITYTAGVASASAVPLAASGDGGQVNAFPAPGTRTASPGTQISLRGIAPGRIGDVHVTGSISGEHTIAVSADSDSDGASLYFSAPFTPGETVSVDTDLPVVGGVHGDYSFVVSHPLPNQPAMAADPPPAASMQQFESAPALSPAVVTVRKDTPSLSAGYYFIGATGTTGPNGPMIVDSTGALVWSASVPAGSNIFDFNVQTYRGQPVLTWWQGNVTEGGTGIGEDVIYDQQYQKIATVKAGNGFQADLHDFTIAGDVALITAYQPVMWDDSDVGGAVAGTVLDSIFEEIDIPTGNVLIEWHSLDHVALTDSFQGASGSDPNDYFHINSLSLGPDGTMLVSSRGTHTVYNIDPDTGAILWRLGGKQSDFTGAGAVFNSQHDAKWITATKISLFDNGSGVGEISEPRSRGMIINLNTVTRTAWLAEEFTSDSVPLATSQGSAQLLPGGNVVIGWGGEPFFSEYSADGELLFEAQIAEGFHSYRAIRSVWSGDPQTPPAAVATSDLGTTTVRASWNGATDVSSWRVLAGEDPSGLTQNAPTPRIGFETSITVAGSPRYVQVQALDSAGRVIGTSPVVSPTIG